MVGNRVALLPTSYSNFYLELRVYVPAPLSGHCGIRGIAHERLCPVYRIALPSSLPRRGASGFAYFESSTLLRKVPGVSSHGLQSVGEIAGISRELSMEERLNYLEEREGIKSIEHRP